MPIDDPELNKKYQREWARRRMARLTPEEKRALLDRRKVWNKTHRSRKSQDPAWRAKQNARKSEWWYRSRYGEFAECKKMLNELYELRREDVSFEILPEVRAEKSRKNKESRNAKDKERYKRERIIRRTDGDRLTRRAMANAKAGERGNGASGEG